MKKCYKYYFNFFNILYRLVGFRAEGIYSILQNLEFSTPPHQELSIEMGIDASLRTS